MDGAGVTEVILQFFILPFVVIFLASLVQMGRRYGNLSSIPWFDTQREAYISLVIAAIVTVAVTLMIGGPELFVLYWRPLITTIIVLPIAFGAALITYGLWHRARR